MDFCAAPIAFSIAGKISWPVRSQRNAVVFGVAIISMRFPDCEFRTSFQFEIRSLGTASKLWPLQRQLRFPDCEFRTSFQFEAHVGGASWLYNWLRIMGSSPHCPAGQSSGLF